MNDDNGKVRSISRRIIPVFLWTSGIVAVCGGLFLLCGQLATARNAAEKVQCQNILRTLYTRIEDEDRKQEIELTHDVIRSHLVDIAADADGELQLHSGPNRDIKDAYVFTPNLPTSIPTESPLTVLACDKPGNHVMHLGNGLREYHDGKLQEQAMLLLSDGSTVFWKGDSTDYEKWVADFVKGKGNRFPPGIDERLSR